MIKLKVGLRLLGHLFSILILFNVELVVYLLEQVYHGCFTYITVI